MNRKLDFPLSVCYNLSDKTFIIRRMLPLLLVLLVLAGCAHNDKTNETTTDTAGPQTALETVADSDEQEIHLPLGDESMTVSATLTTAKQTDAPSMANAATAEKTTAAASTTAKADKETQNTTTTKPTASQNTTTKPAAPQSTTTTTKPAASQNHTTTTTTAPAGGQTQTNTSTTAASGTPKTTGANGTSTTTSAATLPTADSSKQQFELPSIPLT